MRVALSVVLLLLLPHPATADEVGPAVAGLKAKDQRIRLRAARVLERLGPAAASAVPALVAATKDKAPSVRTAAIRALGHIGPKAKAATKTLTALKTDSGLKSEVAVALDRITAGPSPRLPMGSPQAAELKALKAKPDGQIRVLDAMAIERYARSQMVVVDQVKAEGQRSANLARASGRMAARMTNMLARMEGRLVKNWSTYQGLTDPKRQKLRQQMLLEMRKMVVSMRSDLTNFCLEYANRQNEADRLGLLGELLSEGTALLRGMGKRPAREAAELRCWILGISDRYRYRHGLPVAELENAAKVLRKYSKRKGKPTVAAALAARATKAKAAGPHLSPVSPELKQALDGVAKLK